jgi:hypothetical protein
LTIGRPPGLIALDALIYFTTKGERLNQPYGFRKNPPFLIEAQTTSIIINKLDEYLRRDDKPRTRMAVETKKRNLVQ